MNNMTSGSPLKILITFSLPMLLSMVFQQLYSVIDSIIAGNFIGVDGLAATGASYPITTLFIAVATGASVGSSVVISQFFGAKLMERVKGAIYTAIITLFVLALVLTGIGLLSCNFLLSVIGTPENIFADSSAYLRIYVCGLVFLFLYNAATSISGVLLRTQCHSGHSVCLDVFHGRRRTCLGNLPCTGNFRSALHWHTDCPHP